MELHAKYLRINTINDNDNDNNKNKSKRMLGPPNNGDSIIMW